MFNTLKVLAYLIKRGFTDYKKSLRFAKECENGNFEPGYNNVKELAKGVMKASGARVIYHGLENLPEEKGVLFVGNHQSLFDIPLVLQVMESPTAFVGKDSLAKVPGINFWLPSFGCVYMKRDDLRQSMKAILQAGENMKKGLNMVIFPEGTRSRGEGHNEFKKGSLKPATMAKTAIVPFYIDGSYKLFEGNGKHRVTPDEVHVYFGEAISLKDKDRAAQKELADQIEGIVLGLKDTIA